MSNKDERNAREAVRISRINKANEQYAYVKESKHGDKPGSFDNNYRHTTPAKNLPKLTDLSPEAQEYAKGTYGRKEDRFTNDEQKETIHSRDFKENQASWNVEPSSWDEHNHMRPMPDCPQCEADQWHAAQINARPSKASGVCRSCWGLRDTLTGGCNCE